jgi:hypothetical protein
MSFGHRPAIFVLPRDFIAHSHFDMAAYAPEKRMLAWRERVAHVVAVLSTVTRAGDCHTPPLAAEIDRFQGTELVFTDARTDAVDMARSSARISVDWERAFAFHIFVDGGVDRLAAYGKTFVPSRKRPTVLAIDLNQPFRMHRSKSHMLTLFLPVAAVDGVFSDPGVLHGRTLSPMKSVTRLIINRAAALCKEIRNLDARSANAAMRLTAYLLTRLLLENPATPVVDIAFALGFKSASDFSRAFRRAYDTTPGDYRTVAQLETNL